MITAILFLVALALAVSQVSGRLAARPEAAAALVSGGVELLHANRTPEASQPFAGAAQLDSRLRDPLHIVSLVSPDAK